MKAMIKTFENLTTEDQLSAGGKGGTLARLYQAGYPVPDGFVILPAAFDGEVLKPEAWAQAQQVLSKLRKGDTSFAVRSSALSEDSAFASFAGEFETVLDVHSSEMIRNAIHTVRRSRHAERVQAYSAAKGMETDHEIAVVVQQLIRADISGVLFTAEPVNGSHAEMLGNFVFGFGEELVSGEAEAYTFTLARPKGLYKGPDQLKRFAARLFKMAIRLEKDLGDPQDIEWAVADGKLYLLQSRPITTLREYDPLTYDWNSSFTGDYLWARQEPFPEVVTPSTWALWSHTYLSSKIGGIPSLGNIGGRMYLNISLPYSLLRKFGKKHQDAVEIFNVIVSPLPAGTEIPQIPISLKNMLGDMFLPAIKMGSKQKKLKNNYQETIASLPERCVKMRSQIRAAQTESNLIDLWHEQALLELFGDLMLLLDAMTEDYRGCYFDLKKELTRSIGKSDADTLLSTLGGGSGELTSIAPLVGLSNVIRGELNRKMYLMQYGHRHANENELSQPRPYEDPDYLDRLIADFQKNPVDVERLLQKRAAEFEALWLKLTESHPHKAKSLRGKVDAFMAATHKREAVRGEVTRLVGVIRTFFLRAGELLNLAEVVFFLTHTELLSALAGDHTAVAYLPVRRETYEKYKALPPYPGWIRGRFNPLQWAADPNRRADFFNSHAPLEISPDSNIIRGHPGSTGYAEGIVRCIDHPDEGDQLQAGEILVAVTTNVGWTTLFPRAAAVITDIGAPLAHAAIIARELGIPAVVGCGNATSRLQSGDRVRVNGKLGLVEILEQVDE